MTYRIKTRVQVLETSMLPLVLECCLEVRNYAYVYAKIDPRPSGATDCRRYKFEFSRAEKNPPLDGFKFLRMKF